MIKNKFWLEDFHCILNENHMLPDKKMTIESKMNALSRLAILFFFIFLFTEWLNMKNNIFFLILSLFIIIILYYKQKIQMENFKITPIKENFEHEYNTMTDTPIKNCKYTGRINYSCNYPDDENIEKIVYNQNKLSKIDDYNSSEYNTNFNRPTDNRFLSGAPNPKTFVPPVIPVPAMNHAFWKEDQLSTISTINTDKRRFNKDSGYTEIAEFPTDYSYPKNKNCKVKRQIHHQYDSKPKNKPMVMKTSQNEEKEQFTFPYEIKYDGQINYLNDEDSLYYKEFENNPYFKNKYQKNIFEKVITPDNVKINKRNEPINSLFGITEPTTFENDDTEIIEPFEDVNMSNVYDPRFYGYGTSYRHYIDKNLGQPRFYYDDINSVKMPNYISRNNIDIMPFGDSYGSMDGYGNKFTSNIHNLADKHYNDSTMQFRTEMQDRLMRKINAEHWQQKMYPIHK